MVSILARYFLPLSRRNRSSAVVMDSGSTLVILFNFLKSTQTLLESSFFLTIRGDVDGLTSLAYCPLHSVALPLWHAAMDKAYNVLVCLLSASLCAESHCFFPGISVNTSGCHRIKSYSIHL